MSNSVDPDETAHLDRCCLQKPIIIACGNERVNNNSYVHECAMGEECVCVCVGGGGGGGEEGRGGQSK